MYVQIQQRLYKEKGENLRHNYTLTAERPEITQAKINAANFSDVSHLSQHFLCLLNPNFKTDILKQFHYIIHLTIFSGLISLYCRSMSFQMQLWNPAFAFLF